MSLLPHPVSCYWHHQRQLCCLARNRVPWADFVATTDVEYKENAREGPPIISSRRSTILDVVALVE